MISIMVSHASLVAEIETVNSMSTEDRLIHARQRRQEQVQRWKEFEYEDQNGTDATSNKRLVKFGASVTLLEAAARDDIDEVQTLLESKTDPNEANDDGLTALHQACIDNFEDMVQLLINHGANVNAVDSEQWTPLHAACTCGHTEIAKILVNNGADLMALNADHNMPYDICEDNNTLDFVEKAMASRGITQQQINDTRSSRERQIIRDMQTLLDEGKSLDFHDEVGATVLHVAAANGYSELTQFLLLHNCNVNTKDCDGWTPLHAAACWSQHEIVEMLGAGGADPTVKNALGETASDVTEDEEIKTLLAKIKSAMKIKNRKFPRFPGISSRNSSRRASGLRGQSFKGRSKKDKKWKAEAQSEAQFWSGHQETDDISSPTTPTDNNNHIQSKTISEQRPQNGPADPTGVKVKVDGDMANEQNANVISDERDAEQQSDRNSFGVANGPNSNQLAPSSGSNKKEKKKTKKGKKAPAPPTQPSPVNKDSDEQNGKSASLRLGFGSNKRYNLVETDTKENGTGKTLAEVKRKRAQETEEKMSSPIPPGGAQVPQSYSFSSGISENIKQFKGHTTPEFNEGLTSKRKFCVIL